MNEQEFTPELIRQDPWLEPHQHAIIERYKIFKDTYNYLNSKYKSLYEFANWHEILGFHYDKEKKGWWYREWAPEAHGLFLVGNFNKWDKQNCPLKKKDDGIWEVFLADKNYKPKLKHKSLIKVIVKSALGTHHRLPLFIKRSIQDPVTMDFTGQIWKNRYIWKNKSPKISSPFIYEAHVGMAQEKEGIGTYQEFIDFVLPRIKKGGYNTIQLMAVQEHPYYGSFGYHVSNFFAVSSRFGTPEDLKRLIDTAHGMGMIVILDLVHSHAVKNINEGINNFDGTTYQFFHEGEKGEHPAWDSKLFNYEKEEVWRFLLSNIRYWLEEFRFDGFRFDGVTSMMYAHHGHTNFDHYEKYFEKDIEKSAILYLQLANTLTHQINTQAYTIAEDVSGMPGLCRPIREGGIGFNFRLAMGLPEYWEKLISNQKDENWNVEEIWGTLRNRRNHEKTIAYIESHDQALVGDKTLIFWLVDSEMYHFMKKIDQSISIDRGMALHKMIRLITCVLGGEGYLNFIGNEFGHPEWVDFPGKHNNWSYKYARRQWNLVDDKNLKYHFLSDFDKAMIELIKSHDLLHDKESYLLNMDVHNQALMFQKGDLIFVFNFNPSYSIANYNFYVRDNGNYNIVLNSDSQKFGGHGRIDDTLTYSSNDNKLQIYLPNRVALVFIKQ